MSASKGGVTPWRMQSWCATVDCGARLARALRCRFRLACLLLFGLSVAIWAADDPKGDSQEGKIVVTVDQINAGKVTIVGKLGVPLQKLAVITGVWVGGGGRSKPSGPILQVTSINGKKVDGVIEFGGHRVSLLKEHRSFGPGENRPIVGDRVEATVFETGAYIGYTEEARVAADLLPAGMEGLGLWTSLVAATYKVVSGN